MNITEDEFNSIYRLANNLGWEIDRMSNSGGMIYETLMDTLDEIKRRNEHGEDGD